MRNDIKNETNLQPAQVNTTPFRSENVRRFTLDEHLASYTL